MDNVAADYARFFKPFGLIFLVWLIVDLSGAFLPMPALNLSINFLFFMLTLPFMLHLACVFATVDHPRLALFIIAPAVLLAEIYKFIPFKYFEHTLPHCLCLQMLAYLGIQEFEESEKVAQRLSAIYHSELAPTAKMSVKVVSSTVARARGDYSVSEGFARESIAFFKSQSIDSNLLAGSYSDLGVALAYQGKSDEAIAACERGVELMERQPDNKNQIMLALCQNNLGLVYNICGNYNEAKKHYRLSRDIKAQLFGATSERVGIAEVNLASVSIESGDYEAAALHCAAADRMFKNKFDNRKVVIAGRYAVKGEICRKAGQLELAEKHLLKAEKIYDKAPEKAEIDQVYLYLGRLYATKGDSVKALKYFELCRELRATQYGPGHFKTVEAITSCAQIS